MKAKPPQSNLIGNIMTNPTGTIDIVMCVCVCVCDSQNYKQFAELPQDIWTCISQLLCLVRLLGV